jgi:hypothetical protein
VGDLLISPNLPVIYSALPSLIAKAGLMVLTRARVVIVGLDGFPIAALSTSRTPQLCALGGGLGRTSLPSSTYPGFASLLTGQLPLGHRVWCTTGGRDLPSWAGSSQVAVPTLLDRARSAGLKSAAIVGDHLLHRVLRTESADVCWPALESNRVPVVSKRDAYGYATNAAVEPHLLGALSDPTIDFVFGQLNEVDTLGHLGGPLDPSTLECCAATDSLVGEILEALRPEWQRAVVIVVSDHDMVHRSGSPAIDLFDDATVCAMARDVFVDGDAALVQLLAGVDSAIACDALAAVDGVETVERLDDNVLVVAAAAGRPFGSDRPLPAGLHGGRSTARTLALVAGGHPLVPELTQWAKAPAPHLADWAAIVARVLGLPAMSH